jgi:CysZ protein
MNLFAGAAYPLRALSMIARHRHLWVYVLIPIGVNIVIGIALYSGLFLTGRRLILDVLPQADGLTALLATIAQALLLVVLAVSIGFLLVRFGVVLGSPWYGRLSEELEEIITGRKLPTTTLSIRTVLYDISRALQFELKKLLFVASIGIPGLLLNLIPGVGTLLGTAVGISLGVMIACLDFFDGPQERRRRRFRAKLATMRATAPASFGFGLLAFFLVSIPLVNLLAIPLCVTAGTMLVCEQAPDVLAEPIRIGARTTT